MNDTTHSNERNHEWSGKNAIRQVIRMREITNEVGKMQSDKSFEWEKSRVRGFTNEMKDMKRVRGFTNEMKDMKRDKSFAWEKSRTREPIRKRESTIERNLSNVANHQGEKLCCGASCGRALRARMHRSHLKRHELLFSRSLKLNFFASAGLNH